MLKTPILTPPKKERQPSGIHRTTETPWCTGEKGVPKGIPHKEEASRHSQHCRTERGEGQVGQKGNRVDVVLEDPWGSLDERRFLGKSLE